jgi:ribosome maturation factor RimP
LSRPAARLEELIEPIAAALGFELVRVRMSGGAARPTLQVMAERPDRTMDVDDCARLSRAISDAFEANDPISGEYVLEVSSPGIDRPLTRAKDFEAYAGHVARIETTAPVAGRKRFRGVLLGLADGAAVIQADATGTAPAGEVRVPLAGIHDARLVLTDALIEADLKRRKLRDAAEKPKH